MKIIYTIILFFTIILSSFSQTINGRLIKEQNNNPLDSNFSVILQIKLNDGENEILGKAFNLKFNYDTLALQFKNGIYLNFNEMNGYITQPIIRPGGSFTIQNIETELMSGTGQLVTDSWIDFLLFNFTIIDFSRITYVCPHANANGFHFISSVLEVIDWNIGFWECFEGSIPVELTSFTASTNKGKVILNWTTATELNNNGFEILRDSESIIFIKGAGTSTEPRSYSYTDFPPNGTYSYRLKQIDLDGTFTVYDDIEVTTYVDSYILHQNYPNPFNSTTNITYELNTAGIVNLTVYNILGQIVTELVNEYQEAGPHKIQVNLNLVPSGLYMYTLNTSGTTITKKMTLLK